MIWALCHVPMARPMTDRPLPILRVRPSQVSQRVLVVGDPGRAARAASLLSECEQLASNREYVTYRGRFGSADITVCSHGVGSAGAGICFEELVRAGARTIIRAGSCGALVDGIADGELIVATGAVREDGLSPRLAPISYPCLLYTSDAADE